ncbi:hypothetical protein LTR37_004892 [Vermiconidia calcicola]|uniref:Uncharacterized protein n=1 Tax=Vermiconidia calcicola TaxID=1690605 RepID=A0ACC3NLN5_9PEZI|nr:hypothetical protein LTR37_004892 [Vermiconidia calcicola]
MQRHRLRTRRFYRAFYRWTILTSNSSACTERSPLLSRHGAGFHSSARDHAGVTLRKIQSDRKGESAKQEPKHPLLHWRPNNPSLPQPLAQPYINPGSSSTGRKDALAAAKERRDKKLIRRSSVQAKEGYRSYTGQQDPDTAGQATQNKNETPRAEKDEDAWEDADIQTSSERPFDTLQPWEEVIRYRSFAGLMVQFAVPAEVVEKMDAAEQIREKYGARMEVGQSVTKTLDDGTSVLVRSVLASGMLSQVKGFRDALWGLRPTAHVAEEPQNHSNEPTTMPASPDPPDRPQNGPPAYKPFGVKAKQPVKPSSERPIDSIRPWEIVTRARAYQSPTESENPYMTIETVAPRIELDAVTERKSLEEFRAQTGVLIQIQQQQHDEGELVPITLEGTCDQLRRVMSTFGSSVDISRRKSSGQFTQTGGEGHTASAQVPEPAQRANTTAERRQEAQPSKPEHIYRTVIAIPSPPAHTVAVWAKLRTSLGGVRSRWPRDKCMLRILEETDRVVVRSPDRQAMRDMKDIVLKCVNAVFEERELEVKDIVADEIGMRKEEGVGAVAKQRVDTASGGALVLKKDNQGPTPPVQNVDGEECRLELNFPTHPADAGKATTHDSTAKTRHRIIAYALGTNYGRLTRVKQRSGCFRIKTKENGNILLRGSEEAVYGAKRMIQGRVDQVCVDMGVEKMVLRDVKKGLKDRAEENQAGSQAQQANVGEWLTLELPTLPSELEPVDADTDPNAARPLRYILMSAMIGSKGTIIHRIKRSSGVRSLYKISDTENRMFIWGSTEAVRSAREQLQECVDQACDSRGVERAVLREVDVPVSEHVKRGHWELRRVADVQGVQPSEGLEARHGSVEESVDDLELNREAVMPDEKGGEPISGGEEVLQPPYTLSKTDELGAHEAENSQADSSAVMEEGRPAVLPPESMAITDDPKLVRKEVPPAAQLVATSEATDEDMPPSIQDPRDAAPLKSLPQELESTPQHEDANGTGKLFNELRKTATPADEQGAHESETAQTSRNTAAKGRLAVLPPDSASTVEDPNMVDGSVQPAAQPVDESGPTNDGMPPAVDDYKDVPPSVSGNSKPAAQNGGTLSAQPSQVLNDEGKNNYILKVLVPPDPSPDIQLISFIIGPSGYNIRNLRRTGVQVQGYERHFLIAGRKAKVLQVSHRLQELLNDACSRFDLPSLRLEVVWPLQPIWEVADAGTQSHSVDHSAQETDDRDRSKAPSPGQQYSLHIGIPPHPDSSKSFAPRIMGNQGLQLNEIKRATGCDLVHSSADGSSVELRGSEAAVLDAKDQLQRIVFDTCNADQVRQVWLSELVPLAPASEDEGINPSEEKTHSAEEKERSAQLAEDLKIVLRTLTHPVVLVTSKLQESPTQPDSHDAKDPSEPDLRPHRGVTVSSFNTVTLFPTPIVSFNLKVPSRSWDAIVDSGRLRVHFLSATPEGAAVAHEFTQAYDRPDEPFRRLRAAGAHVGPRSWERNRQLLTPPRVSMEGVVCRVDARLIKEQCVQVGDHVIVIAEVGHVAVQVARLGESTPVDLEAVAGLAYARRGYRTVGAEVEPMKLAELIEKNAGREKDSMSDGEDEDGFKRIEDVTAYDISASEPADESTIQDTDAENAMSADEAEEVRRVAATRDADRFWEAMESDEDEMTKSSEPGRLAEQANDNEGHNLPEQQEAKQPEEHEHEQDTQKASSDQSPISSDQTLPNSAQTKTSTRGPKRGSPHAWGIVPPS